ncbi:site-specific DNA-methyltransferase, partial [Aggregatibacter sp.]
KKYAATNDSKGFSNLHDYILVYKKSEMFQRNLLPRTEEQNKPYKNDDNDGRGLWRSDNLLVKSFSESAVYPIINPNTGKEYYPPQGSSWRASKNTMDIWLKENRIFWGKNGLGAPQLKRYLNEVQKGKVPTTWWPFNEVGHNDAANKEISTLFNSKAPFDTPKPTALISQMLKIGVDRNDLILDFFSGSGTTAHAVMQLNAEDNGNRRFICVQLPEVTDEKSEAFKAGFKNIAEISKERIRRAGKQIAENHPDKQLDIGFKVFKLTDSHFKQWQSPSAENLAQQIELFVDSARKGATPDAMLYEILLRLGLKLTAKVRSENQVFWVSDENGQQFALLLETLSADLLDQVISAQPKKVVTLDSLFNGDDALKKNAELQMNDAGIAFFVL